MDKDERITLVPPHFLLRFLIASSVVLGLYLLSVIATGANPLRLVQGLPIVWHMIVEDLFPPLWPYVQTSVYALLETWNMALLATTCAAIISLPLSFLTTKRVNTHVYSYQVCRTVLNILRTIPDIILAILVVAFMGMGAVSGVVALSLYSTAVLSKMLSETVDGLQPGPLEAVTASGGNKLQVICYGIIPQLFPYYLSFVLYVLELNMKTSVILGFIGAGGIGQLIHRNIQYFRYDRLTIVLLSLFVVISLIDWMSNSIRRRFE